MNRSVAGLDPSFGDGTPGSGLLPRSYPDVVSIAHRGLAPGLPENTMAAFRDGITRGVNVIEMDLRGTKDGVAVIMHDETVDRTTDGSGAVSDLTLAEIRSLDAGVHVGASFAGEKVPTFEEALRLAKASGVMLLLDIKLSNTLDRREIVRLVQENNAVLNVIAGVRSLDDLAALRGLNPNIRTLGFIPNPEDIDTFIDAGVEIIRLWPQWIAGQPRKEDESVCADCNSIENGLVKQVQARNRPVWTTANAAPRAELLNLIKAGVNGILTDLPDVLSTLLADIKAEKPRD